MFYPGKVTYARFGLTVYGVIPISSLDVTVGPGSLLWFRDKSHFISVDEVEPLLSPETDVLLIGTGWHGAARVDPAVQELAGIELRVLQTPAAFELFNELVSSGRRVALIAHSTCRSLAFRVCGLAWFLPRHIRRQRPLAVPIL